MQSVVNGYSGGSKEDATYEAVCSGATKHAEVVQITFDPGVITLETILKIFWVIHDPTTLNRQGNDVGTQYRSAIFYRTKQQQRLIEDSITTEASKIWNKPVVTEVTALNIFYPAEEYHQDYFNNHPENAYCQVIINPKLTKLKKQFAPLLKA